MTLPRCELRGWDRMWCGDSCMVLLALIARLQALKKPDRPVGLKNQGATCYMNSFLQQLYAIPSFRNRLLELDDTSEDLGRSPLFQLQVLFGYLRISQKKYYDTKPFCTSFTDYDGQPVRYSPPVAVTSCCTALMQRVRVRFAAQSRRTSTNSRTCCLTSSRASTRRQGTSFETRWAACLRTRSSRSKATTSACVRSRST